MVPRDENGGHVLPGQKGSQGIAVPEGLGERHDVRRHAPRLVGEEMPRPAHSRLDLVENEEKSPVVAEFPQSLQVLRRGDADASLALDGFHEDPAGPVGHGGRRGLQVVVGNVAEPFREGLEAGLVFSSGPWR